MNPAQCIAISARPANVVFGVAMVFLFGEVPPSVPQVILNTNHTRAGVRGRQVCLAGFAGLKGLRSNMPG